MQQRFRHRYPDLGHGPGISGQQPATGREVSISTGTRHPPAIANITPNHYCDVSIMATSRRWGRGARVDDLDTGRKKLLQAAITCFVSKGIQATTIEDIANAANVTRRTVYRYYGGKADLLEAVVELERKRLFEHMQRAAEPYQSDFPRMLEECLASAAQLLSPSNGAPDLISDQNKVSAVPHMLGEEALAEWHALLEEPYATYRRNHGDLGPLAQIIDVLGRLVLSFRYLPCGADDIRQSLEAFLSLSRRKAANSLRLV